MRTSFPSLLHFPEKPTHASLQAPSGVTCRPQLYPVLNPTLPYALHAQVTQGWYLLYIVIWFYVLLISRLPDNLDGDVEDVEVEGVIGDLPPLSDAHDDDEDG
jgi:hypothetical protein